MCTLSYARFESEPEPVWRCQTDSLELDNNLSRLPRQVTHVPVAVKVRDQPERERKRKETLILKANTPAHKHLDSLLDFLPSILSQLVGPGDILLGPFNVFIAVPAPNNHDVLSLLFFLQTTAVFRRSSSPKCCIWSLWRRGRKGASPHDTGGHTSHSRIHTSTSLHPETPDNVR